MPSAIRCAGLFKRYIAKPPVDAVNGLDLQVEVGECFGLLGPNGAGKTTTIEIMEGLCPATSGEVEILGRRWSSDEKALRERIGISLQETRLSDKLSVLETLTLFRSFYARGISPDAAIRKVSLEDKASAWVSKLSGGQKQRLAVACALVGNPELLFLDEPTTGLDPQSRRQLWEIIRQFGVEGRTVLLSTHYMDEAERLCDRVAIVDHGKVIALGTPRELIASLGAENVVEFSLDDTSQGDDSPDTFLDLPSVSAARKEADRFSLSVGEPHLVLSPLLQRLSERGQKLASLTTRHASLEDVFVALAGRRLDDEETPTSEAKPTRGRRRR